MTSMTGPGGTNYEVFADGPNGRAGIADLGEGHSRVRVEPSSQDAAAAMAETLTDWKQPDEDNLRYSIEVDDLGTSAAQDLARASVGATEQ